MITENRRPLVDENGDTVSLTKERLLTADEVSEYLVIPKASLYRWSYLGTGPRTIKVGKHLRYRESDVRAWIDSRSGDQAAS